MTGSLATRREVGKMAGVVVASFAIPWGEGRAAEVANLPVDLQANPRLDSWIRLDADGLISVCTGKAELINKAKPAWIDNTVTR